MHSEGAADILVVDDDPRLRELVRYTLTRAGFHVRESGNGRDALAAARLRLPDLILLDVLMPELDGISVCRELRAESAVPIIFLSTRAEQVDRIVGLDLGGDDYLGKPFAPAELVSRVNAVLRRTLRNSAPTTVAESAAVRVDLVRFEAQVGGQDVSFTRTELRMLHALMAAQGAVQTRRQLVAAAWDGPHFVADRTVDSHVRGIRKKLRDARHDHVETVTGVGWRWRA